jgi:hypothetical protein
MSPRFKVDSKQLGVGACTVSISNARLRASSYQWTAARISLVKRKLPSHVVIVRHQGHIKKTQLDEASIPKGEPDHEKALTDERPLYKQRACILNTDD